MKMNIKRSTLLVSAGLLLALGLSLLFYMLFAYSKVERVFYFPKDQVMTASGESRRIPRHESQEENIREYVQEWMLGPQVLENDRLFPRGTRLNTILLRDGALYLDFNFEILLKEPGISLTFQEILDMAETGLFFNFPKIRQVYFSVEGEPVERGAQIREEIPADSGN